MFYMRHNNLLHWFLFFGFIQTGICNQNADSICSGFSVRGTIFVGWTASYPVPNANLLLYKIPVKDSCKPDFNISTDSSGVFLLCPIDSGFYYVKLSATISEAMRIDLFSYYGLCVPRQLEKTIPKFELNTVRSKFAYAFINEEDPFHPPDRQSCCDEFKVYVTKNHLNCKKQKKVKRQK